MISGVFGVIAALPALLYGQNASAQFSGIDSNALPAPTHAGKFASLQSARGPKGDTPQVGARLSYLDVPISGRQPSPSAAGTTTEVVEGLVLTELLFSASMTKALDVGLAFPIVPYQWGAGLSTVNAGAELNGPQVGDPRIAVGVTPLDNQFAMRLHGTLFLPVGNEDAFTGEQLPRGELGASFEVEIARTTLASDIAGILRETSEFGLTRWGPQLRIGLAGSYAFSSAWASSVELTLLPTLVSQPEPLLGTPGYLFPAEALATISYDPGAYRLLLLGGTGLPFSRPSSDSPDASLSRGPTSPRLRVGIEVRVPL